MNGFRLGRVLGLEVRIDYSWFVIFFLVLWTLTAGVFPSRYPDLSPGVHLLMGLAATLAFFASLLVHELSHSVVARRRGIEVEGITLFLFGGMARTRREAENPRDELMIAGIGPLTSLALAAGFRALGWVGSTLDWPVAVTGVADYLAFINVALAVFNLLPGFPLDGGRIFRAIGWWASGDLTRATRWATTGGRALGYTLIAVGLLALFLAGDVLGGIWLVFIGWFIRTAADVSFTQHLLRTSLAGMRVADLMTPDPATVPAELSADDFVDSYLLRGHHQAYPVLEGDHVAGIATLAGVAAVPRQQWPTLRVRDIMRPIGPDSMVDAEESMVEGLDRLMSAADGRLLVQRDGALVGIVTRADLARFLARARLLDGRSAPPARWRWFEAEPVPPGSTAGS